MASTPTSNFGVVQPGKVYRGAAPSDKGLCRLRNEFGVNLILDLRAESPLFDPARANELDITVRRGNLVDKPNAEWVAEHMRVQVAACVDLIRNAPGSVYVHCAGGRHRTSAVCMLYEMRVMGAPFEEAYRYAREHGLENWLFAWSHKPWIAFCKSLGGT